MLDRPGMSGQSPSREVGPSGKDRLRQALADLGESDAALRRLAAQYLGRLRDDHGLPHLIAAAGDPDRTVRQAALGALVSFGPRAREALVAALGDPQPSVRLAALRGLFRLEGAAAEDIFLEQARCEAAPVRRRAVLYLGLVGGAAAERAVLYGLRDPAAEVRRAAVFALAALRGSQAAGRLIAALEDEDQGVRRQAVRALESLFGRRPEREGAQAELKWKCWWQMGRKEEVEAS